MNRSAFTITWLLPQSIFGARAHMRVFRYMPASCPSHVTPYALFFPIFGDSSISNSLRVINYKLHFYCLNLLFTYTINIFVYSDATSMKLFFLFHCKKSEPLERAIISHHDQSIFNILNICI